MWNRRPELREQYSKIMSNTLRGREPWNKGVEWSEEVKEKLRIAAKKNNQKERFIEMRGGNGKGPSKCEELLKRVLPERFVWNYPIPLGKRQEGYPTNYKVDFGDPAKKMAIEVDGASHNSKIRQEKDRKKGDKLAELGWCVLRISNLEIRKMFGISK